MLQRGVLLADTTRRPRDVIVSTKWTRNKNKTLIRLLSVTIIHLYKCIKGDGRKMKKKRRNEELCWDDCIAWAKGWRKEHNVVYTLLNSYFAKMTIFSSTFLMLTLCFFPSSLSSFHYTFHLTLCVCVCMFSICAYIFIEFNITLGTAIKCIVMRFSWNKISKWK